MTHVIRRTRRLGERKHGCRHSGPGRWALVAELSESKRRRPNEGARRRVLRAITVRSCCLSDPGTSEETRRWFWARVHRAVEDYQLKGEDRRDVLERFAQLVRRPSVRPDGTLFLGLVPPPLGAGSVSCDRRHGPGVWCGRRGCESSPFPPAG